MFNFCFIHNYENNTLMGEMLGYSIKRIYPNHKIIAVIGKNQKKIPYSDISENYNFSKSSIMYDIIHCQLKIVKKYGPTLFLDADMLLTENIDEFVKINKYDMSVTIRPESTLKVKLNENHKKKFPQFEIGYSDHSINSDTCKIALTLESFLVEKHFTLNKNTSNFHDHKISATPNELKV